MAELAKMKLESQGIPSLLPDGNFLKITGLENALGGVRLQVSDKLVEKAKDAIVQFNHEMGISD